MRRWLSSHPKAAAATALAIVQALLGVWLLQPSSSLGTAAALASYDSYYAWMNIAEPPPPNCPVVVIYLDLESHLNRGIDPSKPWPRTLHSQLLRRLTEQGAKAVIFDIVFGASSPDPGADLELASAIRSQGKTILAGELSTSSERNGDGPWARTVKAAPPLELLKGAAAAWGLGEVAVDPDFVSRQRFAGRPTEDGFQPSLTWALGRLLRLPSTEEKAPETERRWLRYYGKPFALPHLSFNRALESSTPTSFSFRDKIVLIGARPMAGFVGERRDELRSPFRSWLSKDYFMPGVEVHATQMLNLLRDDGLRRPSRLAELCGVVLGGLLAGTVLMWLRPLPAAAAALGGMATVAGVAAALFVNGNVWFPWLIIAGLQVPSALAISVIHQSLDWYRTRRRLEAERRAAESRIREQAALIDKAQDAILVLSVDGRITYSNPSATRLYGWSAEELRNGGASALLNSPSVALAIRATLDRGEWSGELSQTTRSGKTVVVESRWTLLRGEKDAAEGLLLINSDVTEKRQLQAESMRMQRMEAIGSLAGGMAHDLNNALAPILMGTQLLKRDTRDDNIQRILGLMEASTRRGAEMVRQVLLFARGRQGDFERLDAAVLVREMEKLARDTFPKDIDISAHIAADLWPVRANATQLHQILLNLCVNARDAMTGGGSLSLAADNVDLPAAEAATMPDGQPGRFVVLIVSDTGSGIPPDVLPRIFEAFFTTKPEGRGTGLGLSTTARIVKSHGGFMNVQSRPGEGSTFEVYLPAFSETSAADIPEAVDAPPRGLGQGLLVAENDASVREILCRTLEEHGYAVASAANGAEAVSRFKRQPDAFALLLCDESMPVLDGAGTVAAVRHERPDFPVILLGGGAGDDGPGGTGTTPPGVERLSKPVELAALLRAVAKALAEGTPRH